MDKRAAVQPSIGWYVRAGYDSGYTLGGEKEEMGRDGTPTPLGSYPSWATQVV